MYVALAGAMLNYGTFMKEWCSQKNRKAPASLKCEASLADGLFQELCKSNELGVEATSSIILTTSVTLILQACTCACYAAVIYGSVYVYVCQCVCVSACVRATLPSSTGVCMCVSVRVYVCLCVHVHARVLRCRDLRDCVFVCIQAPPCTATPIP